MAQYQYNYNRNQQPGRSGKGPDSDRTYWLVAGILLFTFPPVGILMLVLKLFGADKKRTQQSRHPFDRQREEVGAQAQPVARPADYKRAENKTAAQPGGEERGPGQAVKRINDGKGLIVTGTVLSAVFGLSSLMAMFNYLRWGEGWWWMIRGMIPLLCFLGAGVGLLWAGLRKRKKARRFRNYLMMIGRREAITITSLAGATGAPHAAVLRDLQDMLDEEILPLGFIDYERDLLVLSGDGLWDRPQREEKPEEKPAMKENEENAVLQEIRAVNEAISNPKLSCQIDRIGIITAKIFDYQKKNPEKSPQLHSFLSYYLPTTLKILRTYAQLEDQEVAGENISAAMQRVEGMMDKVVEGFEKQLDQLFQSNAMDITTDVHVLEQMLAKDGLSGGGGMRLEL